MKRAAGFTIIEVIVALAVTAVIVAIAVPSIVNSISGNEDARRRTLAAAAAETWLDRYRAQQETFSPVAPCTGSANAFTCSYAANRNYGTDTGIPSHVTDAVKLNEQMAPFSTVITGTLIDQVPGAALWQLRARTTYQFRGIHTVEVSTRVAQ